ncbi:hypothetical protein ACE1TF_04315 [Geomicrobium sp. JSM 1781026]|uniref:hypothetical protein n=1 Tax=Geomicrobium sp. JSM 1781026 TaxID=3344580 RepID=UPI0035BFEDD9
MYRVFQLMLIVGLILTGFRLVEQIDSLPDIPGGHSFDTLSVPSIILLIIGILGTSIGKKPENNN